MMCLLKRSLSESLCQSEVSQSSQHLPMVTPHDLDPPTCLHLYAQAAHDTPLVEGKYSTHGLTPHLGGSRGGSCPGRDKDGSAPTIKGIDEQQLLSVVLRNFV